MNENRLGKDEAFREDICNLKFRYVYMQEIKNSSVDKLFFLSVPWG